MDEYFTRLQGGDTDAFEYIYAELKDPVYTIAYRIVQSRELAEDVAQDVFVKLFDLPEGLAVKYPRAWIFQMTHNAAIDALRREKPTEDIDELSQSLPAGDIEGRLDMEKALAALPRVEREIVSLHLNAELTFSEIADITGLTLSSVYRRYRKSLKILKKLLEVSL